MARIIVHSPDDAKLQEQREQLAKDRIAAFSKALPKVNIRAGTETIASGDVKDAVRAHRAAADTGLKTALREAAIAEEQAFRDLAQELSPEND